MHDRLIPLYQEAAARGGSFFGLSIVGHTDIIHGIIEITKSSTLLDYGCGRGDPYFEPYWIQRYWRVDAPTLYDPAFPQHSTLPEGKFHGVLCSDVLEHVPEEDVDEFIQRLFSHAERFVWASVCCRPAKKSFDDGTNMHVTVKPFTWWQQKFKQFSGGLKFYLTETK